MRKIMFCSEVELGGFVGSIDIVPDAFRAISEISSSSYEFHTSSSGIQILAFKCLDDYKIRFLNGEFDLVSSESFKVVDFIETKVNGSFSINGAAMELFESLPLELKDLKDQLIRKPLIITGLSLGGYVAILFALWLQHTIDLKEASGTKDTKRPICITFGCPLVGDERLQQAISECQPWKSNFLNVVAKTDPIASFFSSNTPYKPFGTSFFCTELGGHTVFEDQESVLAVLDDMALSAAGNTEIPDYGNHLKSIRRKVLYRDVSQSGGFDSNPLRAGITWQFRQIGVQDSNDLIERTENRQKEERKKNKNKAYEPTKKLNDMKISLTYMEWYMKTRRSKGGYYDSHKKTQSQDEIKSHQEIVKHQRFLNQYWKDIVEKKNKMPQKEGANLRTRWLLGGNNYRRIVEPLDIADYYKKGGKDYLANRPNHYKLLEYWLNEDKNDPNNPSIEPKTKAASLTEDSCFWAYVEEALIELKELKNDEQLEKFERYVMGEIKNYSLSPDVFLEGSSLMKWWSEYKQHKGSFYASELAEFMNGGKYKSYK